MPRQAWPRGAGWVRRGRPSVNECLWGAVSSVSHAPVGETLTRGVRREGEVVARNAYIRWQEAGSIVATWC
jgi:hypothetical protein